MAHTRPNPSHNRPSYPAHPGPRPGVNRKFSPVLTHGSNGDEIVRFRRPKAVEIGKDSSASGNGSGSGGSADSCVESGTTAVDKNEDEGGKEKGDFEDNRIEESSEKQGDMRMVAGEVEQVALEQRLSKELERELELEEERERREVRDWADKLKIGEDD
jgi:hypothetical protein